MDETSAATEGRGRLDPALIESVEKSGAELVCLEADHPDLLALSTLIELFEDVRTQAGPPHESPVAGLAWAIDRLLTSILLESTADAAGALALASKAHTALQVALEAIGHGQSAPDPSEMLKAAAAFLGEEAPVSRTAPGAPPAEADPPATEARGRIAVEDPELFGEFVFESNSHLESIEEKILELESNPQDLDLVNEVFRPFHSMKGGAGFLGLSDIQALAHETETLLDRCRKQQMAVTGPVIELTLQSVDTLKALVANVARSTDLAQGKTDDPSGFDRVDYLPLVGAIQARIQGKEPAPPAEAAQAPMKLGEMLVKDGTISEADLDHALSLQGAPLGEILVATGATTSSRVTEALERQKKVSAGAGAIKVDTEKLDLLVNLVGELVITQSLVEQSPSLDQISNGNQEHQALIQNLAQLGKITKDLQDQVMLLRMMPLKQTFQKMARLVRDLSKDLNKNIEFVTAGEETELDRNVIEQIGDPLVHVLRNSLDHGFEPAAERVQAGKSERGTLCLSATHRGENIIITVEDDGRGLPKEKILAKALAAGVIDDASRLSDQQIYNLIFLPGLSTAETVSNVSGRGVGMDVVKRNIEKLRGRVEVDSVPGQGTTLTITLPLTLAIIDGLVIRVGAENYIVPVSAVVESVRPRPEDLQSVMGRGEMLNLRGQLLPLIRLGELFSIEGACADPSRALLVIAEAGDTQVALLVDDLLGQQQVVIKNLGDMFGKAEGLAGATILGNGRVGLILDPEGLASAARRQPPAICEETHA